LEIVITLIMVRWLAVRINALEHELRTMSLSDELTALHNRRGFTLLGDQAVREARRSHTPLSILYIDLDGLKTTNDTFGHEIGSLLIKDMAELLRKNVRGADIAARLGGDEFAVILHGENPGRVLSRVREAAEIFNESSTGPYRIYFSAGVASLEPGSGEMLADLIARADGKMYEEKRSKKAARVAV
jgi:diguanylate cyclase (GGDEF)-like protein